MSITLMQISGGGDLITNARAIENAALAALNSSNPDYLASLIAAASGAIGDYLHRTLAASDYSIYLSGPGYPYAEILLPNYPVISVSRVAASPVAVIQISNGSSSNQRATVASTSTGITLLWVASGVTSTASINFADQPTLSALAGAIAALSNGWSAQVMAGYENFASADIRPLQGAASAIGNGMILEIFTEDLPTWGGSYAIYDAAMGWIGGGPGWRLDASAGRLVGIFPVGSQNIRVDYRAGYDDIPDPVQEACVQLVQDLYQASLINNNLTSAALGPYRYTRDAAAKMMSAKVRGLLAPYVSHSSVIHDLGD